MTSGTDAAPPRQLSLSSLLRPHRMALVLAGLAVLGETATDVLEPWPVKIVVDSILQQKPLTPWIDHLVRRAFGPERMAVLHFALAAVLAIAVVGAVSAYAEKFLTTSVGQWVAHDLRLTIYHHVQRLSLAQYDETRTGDLVTRVTDDIDSIQDFITSALLGIVVNLLTLVGMIAVMFWINWRFTLIALSIAPVLFTIVYLYTRRIKAASRAVRKKQSELLSNVAEILTSIRVVQAFAREDYEERRFESTSLENVEAALRARSLKAKLTPIVEVVVAVGTCLVLGYGANLALSGAISAGTLIVFLMYLSKMYKPMRDLSKMTDTISKAAVGYERIQEVLDLERRIADRPGARRARRFNGLIEFDHVTFGYDPQRPVLTDVSFRVEPGRAAAFVGPSGAGKTTIASLIPRFYDPTDGSIRIDGRDIRDYTVKSLREQIGFVLQDTLLFRTSIWENIAYGRPNAKPREIIRAAKLANAAEFIEQMPNGYGTLVGERGVTLSGGQRQRIAIARAIVRNSPILILDEATANLDASSEQLVVDALNRLIQGRTCVTIAHHIGAIRHADTVFVLKEGRIVAHGLRDDILKDGNLDPAIYEPIPA